jgi:uracil-DNA glycosylase family 4
MNELNLNNENCTKCEALAKCRKQVVNSVGPLDAKILLVGEAPGPDENEQGVPFVGRAGQQLNRMLALAGIAREQVRIVNAVRCFPKNEDRNVNASFRAPTWDEIAACREYLKQEIEAIKPNVIVPLGSVALSAIMGSKSAAASTKITKVRGTEFWSEEFNCKIMPTFHPSACMRDPNREPTVIQDFVRIRESSQYAELSKGDEGNYITLDTLEKADAFFERMNDVQNFVFDLETNSLDWQTGEILEVSFSWKEKTACVLPLTKYIGIPYQEIEIKKRKGKKKVDGKVQVVETEKQVVVEKVRDTYEPYWGEKQEYILGKLKELMESEKGKIGQNLKFDSKWFMQKGWKVNNIIFDTMLAAHLLNENNKGRLDLTSLSKQYTTMGNYDRPIEEWFKEHRVSEEKRNYAHLPEELRRKYACMDADCTYRLFEKFVPLLANENLTDIFNRLILPLNDTLTEAEFRGVKIDRECLKALKQELEADIAALEKRIKTVTGDINLNSPDQLKTLLFKELKLPKIKKTKKGDDSTDVEVLEILADMNPIPQLILDYRKMEKLYNTYVVGIEEKLDKEGYLHGSFNIMGTESGRLSSSDPNLQNIPKKDKRIKKMFQAEEGNVMVEGDLSQAEICFWAEFSRDPQMLMDIANGLDMHRNTASVVYKIPPEQVTDDQRTLAKRTAFGLLYGMGDDKFAKQNKCTIEEAAKGRLAFFGRYPIAKQWLFHIVKEARMNQYVTNLFGRRRHLPGINSQDDMVKYEAEAAAKNSPIQGTASDYTCNAANRIVMKFKELGLHGKLRILIHDAILMDIPKSELEQSIKIMKEEIERPVCNIVVPIRADFSTGPNWGSMTKYEFKKELANV